MRAISLHQPWATAIALGLKTIETRGWDSSYRGRIAIHAAKIWRFNQRQFTRVEQLAGRLPDGLPLGAIVATAHLYDVLPAHIAQPGALDQLYGDFTAGRFAWLLRDVRPLRRPIPFQGRQGWFTVPDELLMRIAA